MGERKYFHLWICLKFLKHGCFDFQAAKVRGQVSTWHTAQTPKSTHNQMETFRWKSAAQGAWTCCFLIGTDHSLDCQFSKVNGIWGFYIPSSPEFSQRVCS